jgi:hypothetical protein
MNMTGCPLQCNCQQAWLVAWLQRRRNDSSYSSGQQQSVQPSAAECYFPERLRGKSLLAVDVAASLGCDGQATVTRVLTGLGCGLAVVLVALSAFLLLHYRHALQSVFKNGLGGGKGGRGDLEHNNKEKDCCDSARRLENEYIIYAVPGGIRAVPITEL